MVAVGSKCRVCKEPAIIDLPRHNAHFCAEHFLELCRRQVVKAIEKFEMLTKDDRILVAVSGGKDSLAVWDLLIDLGYQADGLYIGLGIGEYSDTSAEFARAFAAQRDLHLIEVSLRDQYGYDVPTASKATKRVPCSACGISKRHLFDKAALDGGYTVLVTGHECPMAVGNKPLAYKEALNAIEQQSPGSKAAFYLNFLENMAPLLVGRSAAATDSLQSCSSCGAPTTGDLCAFCRVVAKASAHEPVPVELVLGKGRGRR